MSNNKVTLNNISCVPPSPKSPQYSKNEALQKNHKVELEQDKEYMKIAVKKYSQYNEP